MPQIIILLSLMLVRTWYEEPPTPKVKDASPIMGMGDFVRLCLLFNFYISKLGPKI